MPALLCSNPKVFDDKFKDQLESGLKQKGDVGNAWVGLVAALAKEQSLVSSMGGMVAEGKVIERMLEHTEDPEKVEAVEAALVVSSGAKLRCPADGTDCRGSGTPLSQRGDAVH